VFSLAMSSLHGWPLEITRTKENLCYSTLALRSFLNPTVKRNKVEIANGNFINKWKKPLTELKKKRKAIWWTDVQRTMPHCQGKTAKSLKSLFLFRLPYIDRAIFVKYKWEGVHSHPLKVDIGECDKYSFSNFSRPAHKNKIRPLTLIVRVLEVFF